MYQLFITPIFETFFQKALIGGCIAAIVCSVVGCLVILRRMAFLGDALSHAMLSGLAGGYLFMKLLFGAEAHAPAMLVGSLLAAVVTVASIGVVSRVSRVKEDTAIGIMYTGIFAAGVILVSVFRNYIHIDLLHFIMGDVLGVADTDLWVAAIAASIVLSVIVLFFRYFQLTSFDPVMAASIGMPVALIDYLLTTCVSLVVVSAVSMVGVILVIGLLITPAATAYLLSDRLDKMMVLSAIFAVTSVIGGLYISIWIDSAGGGAIMLFCTAQFLAVLLVAPKYGILAGWQRRRSLIPQQLLEDIMGAMMRSPSVPVPLPKLTGLVSSPVAKLHKAVKSMERRGLVLTTNEGIILSDQGKQEAQRLLRAHRLWETYLRHVGMPVQDLHDQAHKLEHVHEQDSMEYLDDLLGHPVIDPHGKEIPSDPRTTPGNVCTLSTLRENQTARVITVSPSAHNLPLREGSIVRLGPRTTDGTKWTVHLEDGATVLLDHKSADAVSVRAEKPCDSFENP
jgi:ABC-type Mn2+/Zn2+ transport system permease subunit/Mn-dependent DtxR family transcriptional regulator